MQQLFFFFLPFFARPASSVLAISRSRWAWLVGGWCWCQDIQNQRADHLSTSTVCIYCLNFNSHPHPNCVALHASLFRPHLQRKGFRMNQVVILIPHESVHIIKRKLHEAGEKVTCSNRARALKTEQNALGLGLGFKCTQQICLV